MAAHDGYQPRAIFSSSKWRPRRPKPVTTATRWRAAALTRTHRRKARGSARQRAGTRPAMDDHRPTPRLCSVAQLLGVSTDTVHTVDNDHSPALTQQHAAQRFSSGVMFARDPPWVPRDPSTPGSRCPRSARSRPQSGQRGSAATDVQKIVVCFSSTAASVIITPNSMVRMIVSATTDGGQTVASGLLGAVGGECRNPNRHPPRTHLSPTTRHPAPGNHPRLVHSHVRRDLLDPGGSVRGG